ARSARRGARARRCPGSARSGDSKRPSHARAGDRQPSYRARLVSADLPSASVVIPNYNGMEHLDDCLGSLRALQYPGARCEVVVVDNGSDDGSAAWIHSHYPEVRVVEPGRNLGFAGGCNLGARESDAAIVAFLNN